MKTKQIGIIVLSMFIVSLGFGINISPAAATPQSLNWTRADAVSTETTSTVSLCPKDAYATANPMEGWVYAQAIGLPEKNVGTSAKARFDYYFTPSEIPGSFQLQINTARLNYRLGNCLPYQTYAKISVSAYIYPASGGTALWQWIAYSDKYNTGWYDEKVVTLGPTTWGTSSGARIGKQSLRLSIYLEAVADASNSAQIATAYGDDTSPATAMKEAHLTINSVQLTLTPGLDFPVTPSTQALGTTGRATTFINLASHYTVSKGFWMLAWSDLPNANSPSFYCSGRNLAGSSNVQTIGTQGYGEFFIDVGGSISFVYSISFSGAASGGTYHIYVKVSTYDSPPDVYTRTVLVTTSSGGGGGGGGGCPNLLVWNGSGFVDEGVLNIHNLVNPDSDVVVQHVLTTTPTLTGHHRYTLKLAEIGAGYNYSHSWIDQVKLYGIDDDGVWHLCSLVFANSSAYGNMLPLLLGSDDKWAQTFKGDEITLQFRVPSLDDISQFIFVIEGHNIKTV